eukprot:GHVP01010864.1.p1 GENE.GHVP01010864.1~~GHVP01010864.1.p1  ORF type:complete len:205 (+),score=39.48 GHVP01010864.1:94-708(+)
MANYSLDLEGPVLSGRTFSDGIIFTYSQSEPTLQNIEINNRRLKWLSDRLEVKIGKNVKIWCDFRSLWPTDTNRNHCIYSVARNGFFELEYELEVAFLIDDNLSDFLSYFDTSRLSFVFKFTDKETVPRMVQRGKISFLGSKEVLNLANHAVNLLNFIPEDNVLKILQIDCKKEEFYLPAQYHKNVSLPNIEEVILYNYGINLI